MESHSIFVESRPALSRAVEGIIESGEVRSERIALSPGDYLFRHGAKSDRTYYIQRGLVRLFSSTPAGNAKTVFLHRAGSLIGFQNLRDDGLDTSILDAQATATCEVAALDKDQFRDWLRSHGDICYELACYLFDMMSAQTRESVNGSMYSVLQRFAALLLTIARELNLPQAPAVMPFTNADLASMLGVHSNSVTNAITSLRRAGCVERQHGYLLVTDYRKLKQVAGDLVRPD